MQSFKSKHSCFYRKNWIKHEAIVSLSRYSLRETVMCGYKVYSSFEMHTSKNSIEDYLMTIFFLDKEMVVRLDWINCLVKRLIFHNFLF